MAQLNTQDIPDVNFNPSEHRRDRKHRRRPRPFQKPSHIKYDSKQVLETVCEDEDAEDDRLSSVLDGDEFSIPSKTAPLWTCEFCTFINSGKSPTCACCSQLQSRQHVACPQLLHASDTSVWPSLLEVSETSFSFCEVSSVGSSWLDVAEVESVTSSWQDILEAEGTTDDFEGDVVQFEVVNAQADARLLSNTLQPIVASWAKKVTMHDAACQGRVVGNAPNVRHMRIPPLCQQKRVQKSKPAAGDDEQVDFDDTMICQYGRPKNVKFKTRKR